MTTSVKQLRARDSLVLALKRAKPASWAYAPGIETFHVRTLRRVWEVAADATGMALVRQVEKASPLFPPATRELRETYTMMLKASPPQVAVVDAREVAAAAGAAIEALPARLRDAPGREAAVRVGGRGVTASQLLEALRMASAREVAMYFEYVALDSKVRDRIYWLILRAPGFFAALPTGYTWDPVSVVKDRFPEVGLHAKRVSWSGQGAMTLSM
jgi:hypothetical protein